MHRPPTWSLLTAQVKIVNIYFYLNIVLTFWPHPHKTTIFNHLEHKSLPQSRLGGGHPSGYLEEEFCSLLPSIFRDRPQEPLTVLHICFEKRRPSWKTMGPVLNAAQTINWCKKPWRKNLVSQMRFFLPSLTSLKEGVCCFWRVGFFFKWKSNFQIANVFSIPPFTTSMSGRCFNYYLFSIKQYFWSLTIHWKISLWFSGWLSLEQRNDSTKASSSCWCGPSNRFLHPLVKWVSTLQLEHHGRRSRALTEGLLEAYPCLQFVEMNI